MKATSIGDEERLEQILEEWFARRHAGESPDLTALCAGAPELQSRVERLLDRHAALLETDEKAAGGKGPTLVDRLGDYRLKARIGRGGMGEVFLARQESLGRLVALKVLRPDLAADPSRRLRFRREAEITAALDHPNIVPVFETGEQDGYVFIAMKLLDGQTLDEMPRPWEPRELASIGAQVARALHAAHEVGVVHRDVKPANILCAERPYVLDFGLARARVDLSLTGEGQAPGTLSFMAPEQLQGGPAALDPRIDVYALGATLYTCLTGRPPFEEERAEVLVRRILVQEPAPLGGSAVGRDLETIVLRALDKEPARRFASALEMAEDLERFAGGYPIRSRPCSLTTRTVRLVRRHRFASAAMAVILLVVAVLGGLLWDSRRWAAAEHDRQIETARDELRRHRFADARATIDGARRAFGEDAVLCELESRALTTLRRDALLDQLQAGRRYQDVAHLKALADQLDGGHPTVLAQPHTGLALLVLAFYRRDQAGLRAGLDDSRIVAGFPRCCAALTAVLDGRDPVVAIEHVEAVPPAETAVDDHVFTAVVLRIAQQPLDAIEAELLLARDIDREHVRYRFGHALLYGLRGDTTSAEEVLVGLLQDGIPRPEVHVMRARIAARRGDFVLAREQLDAADEAVERAARPRLLRLDLARLEVFLLEGAVKEFEQSLADAKAQWGATSLLSTYEGYQAYLRGDIDGCLAAFESAVANAVLPWSKRRAEQALLSLEVEVLKQQASNGEDVSERLPSLFECARALRTACRQANEPTEESDALVDLTRLYLVKGAGSQAWRTLREAIAIQPPSERALFLLVRETWKRLCASKFAASADDPHEVGLAREAIACARRYHDRSKKDVAFAQRAKLAQVLTYATDLAVFLGDRETAAWAGAHARINIGDSEQLATFAGILEECREELGLSAWPEVSR